MIDFAEMVYSVCSFLYIFFSAKVAQLATIRSLFVVNLFELKFNEDLFS